jgi:hypothetical protein
MRFLIQKCKGKIVHDFSFTLLESIRYLRWSANGNDLDITVKYLDFIDAENENRNWWFKPFHQHYIPVGSVEFVTAWFKRFHDHKPLPINVPEELWGFANRTIWNGDENGYKKGYGRLFVKSNDHIKGFKLSIKEDYELPKGNYQFSEEIDIESEWRGFVYQNKLVGLQNYSGDFTMFPDVSHINFMISQYKSAPVAYTLDVGVFDDKTFVIECHDFFSCGLYGFADHRILPFMHSRWHYEYLKNTVHGN